ncbi:MAG: hypothetical protein ACYC96_16070 [Fimbriimonadaceae bacterium]
MLPKEYAWAYGRFVDHVVLGLMDADPLMSNFPTKMVRHRGPARNWAGPEPVDHAMDGVGSVLVPELEDVRETRLIRHTELLWEISRTALADAVPRALRVMEDVQRASGRLVPGSRGSVWESYLAALEQLDLAFDENGKSLGGKVFMNSQTARLFESPMPEDFLDRARAIVEAKRRKWVAETRHRRLPREHQ